MASVRICVVVLALSGFQRQAAALPVSTVQVRVGEDVTLQCPLLEASNATATTTPTPTAEPGGPPTISWYRKAAGQGPMMLLSIVSRDASKLKYGAGVPRQKVSASADGSLLLRGSERRDSAVYYCGVSRGSDQGKQSLWALPEP
ncbi:uncharacterized protein ACNS7B_003999 [Menidia menidia]